MKPKSRLLHTCIPLLALVLAALLAACAPPAAAPAGPIKIGWISHTSAPAMAPFYVLMQKSIGMAEAEINAKGGVLGRKIEIIEADDQMRPDQSVINAEKLIAQDKVIALIGPAIGANVEAVAPIAEKYQIPNIGEIAAVPEQTQKGRKYFFRHAGNSNQIIEQTMEFVKTLNPQPKTLAFLHENRSFGLAMAEPFKKLAAAGGYQVVAVEPYDATALDFKPMLLRVKALNPDAILAPSYVGDAILLVKQAREMGLTPKYFVGIAAGYVAEDFLKGAGDAAEGTYVVHQWFPVKEYPGAVEFAQKFTKDTGKIADHQPATAYGVLYTLTDAIKRAGSTEGPKIMEALAKTDLMGPFGRIKYNEGHDNVGIQMIVSQVKGGTWVVQWPSKQAGTTYPK